METTNNLIKNNYSQFIKKMYQLMVFVLLIIGLQSFAQYVPPIGIPAPSFGLNEEAPAWPEGWPSTEVPNYYYVDNTHLNASGTNAYGTPNAPRTTFPEGVLAEGTYIELHGGPYNGGGQIIFTANGTAENPVWLRGKSSSLRAEITGEMIVKGTYVIIENLVFTTDNAKIGIRPHNASHADHISVRNCEMYGSGTDVGFSAAIGIGGTVNDRYTDIVVYNNTIYNRGNYLPEVAENDYHGVAPGRNVDRVWVLNNHIHHMGGDAVQIGAASISDEQRPSYIYLGGNDFHDNHENAVDVKESDHVFVIDNDMYNYEATSSSSGNVVIVHNGAANVWIANNRVYNGTGGIATTTSSNTWFIANIIWNIHTEDFNAWNPNSGYSNGTAIHFRGADGGAVNNTIYNYDNGIQFTTAGPYQSANNILFGRTQTIGYDLRIANSTVRGITTSNYNLYGSANIDFSTGYGTNIDSVQSTFSQELNSLEVNPQVVNAANNNFSLQSNSNAIDSGELHSIYASYYNTYGESINVDTNGIIRPQNSLWDIGAYEYGSTLSNNGETLDVTISINPNPTSDILTIDLDDDMVKKVIIYNELGQHIKETTTKEVNISNLSKGIYFVKITLLSGKETIKKIIKN